MNRCSELKVSLFAGDESDEKLSRGHQKIERIVSDELEAHPKKFMSATEINFDIVVRTNKAHIKIFFI